MIKIIGIIAGVFGIIFGISQIIDMRQTIKNQEEKIAKLGEIKNNLQLKLKDRDNDNELKNSLKQYQQENLILKTKDSKCLQEINNLKIQLDNLDRKKRDLEENNKQQAQQNESFKNALIQCQSGYRPLSEKPESSILVDNTIILGQIMPAFQGQVSVKAVGLCDEMGNLTYRYSGRVLFGIETGEKSGSEIRLCMHSGTRKEFLYKDKKYYLYFKSFDNTNSMCLIDIYRVAE